MRYLADKDAVSEPLDTVETAYKVKCFNGENAAPYNIYLNRVWLSSISCAPQHHISVPYICPEYLQDPVYITQGDTRHYPQLNSIVFRVLRERSEHRTDQRGNQCDMALYNGDLLRLREWILVFCSL